MQRSFSPAGSAACSAPLSALPSAPTAPTSQTTPGICNLLTVDVEDYFHVSGFDGVVPRSLWATLESRVCRNTERLLTLFEGAGVRATFFVLGWVAGRFPALVRRIQTAGHEVASHGYGHRLVYADTIDRFRSDVRRAKAVIEDITGAPVLGYRAPSFSITRHSLWALDVLIEEGFHYDASIYPIHHDRYGIADAPRHIHPISRPAGTIWEIPGSTVRYAGVNLPVGGGGYFRLLPYSWTRAGFHRLNHTEGLPGVFYIHPWEIDPGQPRLPGSLLNRFRHYRNLRLTESRLQRLLNEFAFGSIDSALEMPPARLLSTIGSAVSRRALMPLRAR